MITAWGWTERDSILHVLPLHHVHGIINCLMTPLYCGATCVMMPKFDASKVWSMLLSESSKDVNLLMAVPTVYAKLIDDFEKRSHKNIYSFRHTAEYVKAVCTETIRLMVSGSAALPAPVMHRWYEITGHTLLERYGMTETCMVLSNPLHGDRMAGTVGTPLPNVEVCIAQSEPNSNYKIIAHGTANGTTVTKNMENEVGELYVKGPTVFREYWNKREETADAFTHDEWFKTGDTAQYTNGVYKILGRTSVDIIKSGGYKLSALDIERQLLEHKKIAEIAVVGLPDVTWGQKVAAVIATKDKKELTQQELKMWAKNRMPHYSIPTVIKCVDAIPRNNMGKVNKKLLIKEQFP